MFIYSAEFLLITTITLLLHSSLAQSTSPCASNKDLPNLLQMQQTIQITSSAASPTESFISPFAASIFTAKPSAIISIKHYHCSAFSQINYRVWAEVADTQVVVRFSSANMTWASLGTVLWLTARPDIYFGILQAQNLKSGLNNLVAKLNKPYPEASSGETSFLNLVNGMVAGSAVSLYSFNISSPSINTSDYNIIVSVDKDVFVSYLKLDFLLYNLRTSLFASDGGFTTSGLTTTNPIHIHAHHNFAPIRYFMSGWDSLKLTDNSLMINFDLDKDMVISITTPKAIALLRAVYLTVGTRMNEVCSQCGTTTFAIDDLCVGACPFATYAYQEYKRGGQSCLSCSAKLNETLNKVGTGCVCIDGFTRTSMGSCELNPRPSAIVSPVSIAVNNSSATTTTTVSSTVTVLSPNIITPASAVTSVQSSLVNTTVGVASGSNQNIPGSLRVSPIRSNSVLDVSTLVIPAVTPANNQAQTTLGTNSTKLNNTNASSLLSVPQTPQVPSITLSNTTTNAPRAGVSLATATSQSLVASTSCKQNFQLNPSTGKCECDAFSIKIDDTICYRCPDGSFKQQQLCNPCPGYCLKCKTVDSCDQCEDATLFDPKVNSCVQNSSHNASGSTSASTSSLNANSTGSSFNSIDGGFSSEGSSFGSFDNGFSSAGSSFGNDGFSPSGGSSFDSFDSSGSSFGVNPVSNTSSPSAVVANSAPASNTTSLANATTQNRTNASSNASTPTTSAQNTVVIGGITINPSTPVPPIVIEPTSNLVICHDNQKLLSGQCVCDDFSIAIDEVNCFRCVPGSFKDDAFCSSCIDQCINCTSTHNCFQCVDGWHYNSQKHLCQFQTTLPPPLPVDTPSSNFSSKCNSRSVFYNNGCTECAPPTYKGEQGTTCEPCSNLHPSCLTCESAMKCLICEGNLKVDSSGKGCACLPPFYILDSGCLQCPPNFVYVQELKTCANPAVNLTNSTTLPTNSANTSTNTSINTSIVTNNSATPVPTTVNTTKNTTNATATSNISTTTNQSIKCKQNEELDASSRSCVCVANMVNQTGTCKPCDAMNFKFGEICVPCPPDCLRCTEFTNCLECRPRFIFNAMYNYCEQQCAANQALDANNNCVCVAGFTPNPQGLCSRCPAATILDVSGRCVPCPQGCAQCSSPTQCTACQPGLSLVSNFTGCCRVNERYNSMMKICECQVGFKNITNVCGKCPEGLVYVDSQQKCVLASTVNNPPNTNQNSTTIVPIIQPKQCNVNQIQSGLMCICRAQTFRNAVTNQCEPCQPAMFSTQNQSVCVSCVANCLNCTRSQSCDMCHANYTGKVCEACQVGYVLNGDILAPQKCIREECGNRVVFGNEQCDDGNLISGDGCSSRCLVENGYVCLSTGCTQLIIKTGESITSAGVLAEYRYMIPEAANNANMMSFTVGNGTASTGASSRVKWSRPANDPALVRVFVDYCGLLPSHNITTELTSNSQVGVIKYVSEYNLGTRSIIPRTTVLRAIKDDEVLA